MTITDAEKTRLLAEGVMGWGWDTSTRTWMVVEDGEPCHVEDEHWSPLTNEAHAAEVLERMRELGWHYEICSNSPGYVYVEFFILSPRREYFVSGETVPTTICHAALLALGLAKEEEL